LTYTAWTNVCVRTARSPAADFSVFYHLISIDRNRDIMLKVALSENDLHLPTFTKLFPNANWYERETWEMFGMTSMATRT
jgi:NADH-quinone oxidoreductase subunit C/D